MKTSFAYLTVLCVSVAAIVVILSFDEAPTTEMDEDYCKKVELYHTTGGEFGWPPYKGECRE